MFLFMFSNFCWLIQNSCTKFGIFNKFLCLQEWYCAKTFLRQVGDELFKTYSDAVQVEKLDGQLKVSKVPIFTGSQLVYLKESPNFYQCNITYGIQGVSNTQCYPDHSSCDSMCGSLVKEEIVEEKVPCMHM